MTICSLSPVMVDVLTFFQDFPFRKFCHNQSATLRLPSNGYSSSQDVVMRYSGKGTTRIMQTTFVPLWLLLGILEPSEALLVLPR